MKKKIKIENKVNDEASYNDYPQAASTEAKKAIDWKEKYGDQVKGGTRVGWTRARQIVNRENLTLTTLRRIYSFFSRHKGNETVSPENKDTPWKDNGYIAWLIWGGDPMAKWVEKKLKEIER